MGAIIAGVLLDMVVWILFTVLLAHDDHYFNPIENYEKWDEMNWLGVWVFTIIYWIVFLPLSILVGVTTGLYKLFTFGRR